MPIYIIQAQNLPYGTATLNSLPPCREVLSVLSPKLPAWVRSRAHQHLKLRTEVLHSPYGVPSLDLLKFK